MPRSRSSSSPSSKLIIDFVDEEANLKIRACKIILDRKPLGEITNGERKEFDISPGKHLLFITRKPYKSLECKFTAAANKDVFLEVRFEAVETYPKKFAVVVSEPDPVKANPPVMRKG